MQTRARFITYLLLGYLGLLLYASLMPYDLDFKDSQAAAERRSHACDYWPFGSGAHTSKADVLSNLLLYVPLGFLVATRRRIRRLPMGGAILVAVLLCAAVSAGVEYLQSYSGSRTSSAQDLLMNTIGGLAGGLIGSAWGRRWYVLLLRWVRVRNVQRPLSLVAALMLIMLAADALYPFRPSLDMGSLREAAKISLTKGFHSYPWYHWAVTRVCVYAALAFVLGGSRLKTSGFRWVAGALGACMAAGGLEFSKLFIEGGYANYANVLTSVFGAVAGMIIGGTAAGRFTRRAFAKLSALFAGAYIVYLELLPFTFTWNSSEAKTKMPHGAHWLPLYDYAMHGGLEDVRLFAQGLILAAMMTFFATTALPRRTPPRSGWAIRMAILGGLMGFVLEMAQFLLPGRTPSTTDVFIFALGGGIGGWIGFNVTAHRKNSALDELVVPANHAERL